MPLRIATESYFESLGKFEVTLPPGKDSELLILKGHLLIERLLEKFLNHNLANPNEIEDTRLTFAQKISIVAAISDDVDSKWLWESIRSLNKIRNDLAHRLESAKYQTMLETFMSQVESSTEFPKLNPPSALTDRLHKAIFCIHEAMSHRVDL